MKCTNCGNIISDNADFCPVCGERTSPVPYDNGGATFRQRNANGAQPRTYQQAEPVYDDGYAEQENYDDQDEYYEEEAPRSNRAMIGVLIAMGVIIVILVIVLISILFKNKNPNTPANTSAPTTEAQATDAATTLPGQTTLPAATAGVVTTVPGASVVVTTSADESGVAQTTAAPATTASPTDGMTPGNYVVSTAGDNLRIRKGQGTDYDQIGSIPNGTAVTAYTNGGDWAYVTYGGISGWVSMQFLKAVAG